MVGKDRRPILTPVFSTSESFKGEMSCRDDGITFKELLPIVFACAIWGDRWRNTSVRVFCDNMGTMALVNSRYFKAAKIMHVLRCLFFIWANFDLYLEAVHLPGVHNQLADAISRDNLDVLFSQVSATHHSRSPLPPVLVSLIGYHHYGDSPAFSEIDDASSFDHVVARSTILF